MPSSWIYTRIAWKLLPYEEPSHASGESPSHLWFQCPPLYGRMATQTSISYCIKAYRASHACSSCHIFWRFFFLKTAYFLILLKLGLFLATQANVVAKFSNKTSSFFFEGNKTSSVPNILGPLFSFCKTFAKFCCGVPCVSLWSFVNQVYARIS
jgi:hypothetical protein